MGMGMGDGCRLYGLWLYGGLMCIEQGKVLVLIIRGFIII